LAYTIIMKSNIIEWRDSYSITDPSWVISQSLKEIYNSNIFLQLQFVFLFYRESSSHANRANQTWV